MYNFIFVDDDIITKNHFPNIADWQQYGFNFLGAFDAPEKALEFMSANKVHLVLSDIAMPSTSGIDFAMEIKSTYPDIVIVFITAYEKFEYALAALKIGVFDYISKPFSRKQITDMLTNVKKFLDGKQESEGMEYDDTGDIIKRASDYMKKHIGDNITREDVARHVHMSPDYFGKYFKQHTGKNFIDFYNNIKMQHAGTILLTTDIKIYELAHNIGFKSMHHFLTLFKQYYDCTPQQYRALKRKTREDIND